MKILNKKTESGKANLERPLELQNLERNLENELSIWHTKIDVEIDPPNLDDIFKVGTSVWIDDGTRTDIKRKGHGLQRALIFALIKAWAKSIKEQKAESSKSNDDSSGDPTRKASDSSYFIFEEPELYLHPQGQRELLSSLIDLSKSKNQVLICTHSSSFIDLKNYKSICIVKKNSIEEGTTILQCQDDLFTLEDEKTNFNLVYWLNPDRSELFFSQKIILVEGHTDKTVVSFLAKELNVFRYEYTLIDCGGKDSMVHYIKLFNKFGLKYTAVYDKDHQSDKKEDSIAIIDKSSKIIEDSIDHEFGSSVILVNDIEEEIGLADGKQKNKPYIALKYISSDSYEISSEFESKIKLIYQ